MTVAATFSLDSGFLHEVVTGWGRNSLTIWGVFELVAVMGIIYLSWQVKIPTCQAVALPALPPVVLPAIAPVELVLDLPKYELLDSNVQTSPPSYDQVMQDFAEVPMGGHGISHGRPTSVVAQNVRASSVETLNNGTDNDGRVPKVKKGKFRKWFRLSKSKAPTPAT
ncbi:hypothetical protein T439DRAFT_324773 [Meredithblackwellia eburnea MCA 4105]